MHKINIEGTQLIFRGGGNCRKCTTLTKEAKGNICDESGINEHFEGISLALLISKCQRGSCPVQLGSS